MSHSTIGVIPAKLLFNRKQRTKVPQFEMYCDYDFDVQKCINKDVEIKKKGKMYADAARNAATVITI